MKKIVQEGYEKAIATLKLRCELLDKVSVELITKESLDQDEFEKIVGKKTEKAGL